MEAYLPVPAASKTLAWLSAGLPDEYSSGHGRDSSTDLLQIDEMGGDNVNCRPSSLAMLLAYIVCKFPVATSHSPSLPSDDFISFRLPALLRSPLGSSDISWFKTVPFACESTQSKFKQRFYEGTSLSSIMPSVSRS